MMGIIIDDPDAAYPSLGLKAPFSSRKLFEAPRNFFHGKTQFTSRCLSAQGIEDIMPARHDQMAFSDLFTAEKDIIVGAILTIFDIFGAVVRILCVDAIADDLGRGLFPDAAHLFIIIAKNGLALFLDLIDKLLEGFLDLFFRSIMVQMVIFNICNDSQIRTELKEGPIAFVSFCYDIIAFAIDGVGS